MNAVQQPAAGEPRPPTLFERAARVFEGSRDEETGHRVLFLTSRERQRRFGIPPEVGFTTPYHQNWPFLEGGRQVLLRAIGRDFSKGRGRHPSRLLDLESGEIYCPWPDEHWFPVDCNDRINTISYRAETEAGPIAAIQDYHSGKIIARSPPLTAPGWQFGNTHILADGRRAVYFHTRGRPYDEPVDTRTYLLDESGQCPTILSADGYFCNHYWYCPSDPNLFAYDRWPCPKRRVEQVIHIASVDGTLHQLLPLAADGVKPGNLWGGQRDHFVWTADGTRICSYVSPLVTESKNHYEFGWWLSVVDWRTGAETCVEYPPDRWGCNFQTSPDSRYIVSAGGPGFLKLYAIDIARLGAGWNERVLCRLPSTRFTGLNSDEFTMPFVLPDQSGVIFSAGWPGDTHGVYLVEWPKDLG
jgi:hypothetical protein